MQRIVTVPKGKGTSARMNKRNGEISGMLEVRVYAIDFFRLSKISLPSSTPVTIEAKLSSSRIMSAACLETSDPAIPIATPMSAFFRAGESLTPSPVTATILPIRWQPSTMISFCCGEVLAKTISVWYIRISSRAFSERSLISPPCTTAANCFSWVDLHHRNSLPCGDIFHSLSPFRDDANRAGNSLGSDWMVTGDHDNLDTSRPALQNSIGHGGPRRVNHGHEADEAKAFEGEVLLVGIVGVAGRVLVLRQHEVTETKDTLTEPTKLHVRCLEGILPVLSKSTLLTIDNDGATSLQNSLRGSLHHQQGPLVRWIRRLVDRHLELVCRVERDLNKLLVLRPVLHHVSVGQLRALEDGRLRGVAIHLPLQDAHLVLPALELRPVAQHRHAFQGFPAGGRLVKGRARLVLAGVRLHNLVVKPHVRHRHPVLGEGARLVRADA